MAGHSSTTLTDPLRQQRVVPLVQADDRDTGIAIAQALLAGGMRVIEVVQRTDASLECLEHIARALPDAIIGAGTVLSAAQAETCIRKGARFIVSPGLDDGVVAMARQHGVDVFPGIMTPSELQHAHGLGLQIVKYFPASIAGGVAGLKALSSVFRQMRFMPTGGISATNLQDYLAVDSVIACGGSWLTPKDAIADGRFDDITVLAREALTLAGIHGGGTGR